MEALFVLVAIALVIGLPVGAVMGMMAWAAVHQLRQQIRQLERQIESLRHKVTASSRVVRDTEAHAAQIPAIPPVDSSTQPQPAAEQPISWANPSAPNLPAASSAPPNPWSRSAVEPVARPTLVDPALAAAATVQPMVAASEPVAPAAPPPSPVDEVSATQTAEVWLAAAPPGSADDVRIVPPPPQVAPNDADTSATDFESVIGRQWLTWSGVALVFLSGVFLLKYAYDQDWFGRYFTPPMRIGAVALVAVAMLATGLRLLGQGMIALGQGLAGGGLAVAYLAVYGGFSPSVMLVRDPLFSGVTAFALMASITAVGMTLAVRADAMAMAFCAVLGGFATPVLIDTGSSSREALFTYVLLLDLGVLAAAWFRSWRALDVLAFTGTAVLVAGWMHGREAVSMQPWGMLAWLLLFHLVFLLLPFAQHWRRRTPVTVERFALAVGNLAFTLGYAAVLLQDRHQSVLAWLCLALAGLYAGIGALTRSRIGSDHKVVHGFLALGAMLLTLGLFHLLPVEAIATAWAAEAVALLALGYLYQHPPTRWIAHAVLACAVLRLAVTRLPPDLAADFVVNGWLMAWLVAPLGLAWLAAVHRWFGSDEEDRRWQTSCWWLAGAALLLLGSGELARHGFAHSRLVASIPQVSWHCLWWMAGGLGFLVGAWRWRDAGTAQLAAVVLLSAVVLGLSAYSADPATSTLVANGRFAIVILAVAMVGCLRMCLTEAWIPTLVHVLATVAVTCETVSWCHGHVLAGSAPTYATWAVALVLTGSSLIAVWRARSATSADSWWLALVLGCLAVVPAMAGFANEWHSALPFLNQRFIAPAAVVAALIAVRRTLPLQAEGQIDRASVAWVTYAVAFTACTCEAPVHFLQAIADRSVALRVATFSVTVVWVVLATSALATGFHLRLRVVRFLGLGLFALIAAKLVLFDMSGVQQIYRILAFLLVGVVLIAASYAYHRLERRFLNDDRAP